MVTIAEILDRGVAVLRHLPITGLTRTRTLRQAMEG